MHSSVGAVSVIDRVHAVYLNYIEGIDIYEIGFDGYAVCSVIRIG